MKQLALLTCAAGFAGMMFVTTDAAISEAGAQSREDHCHRVAKRRSHRAHRPGEAALGAGLGSAALGAIIGGIAGGGRGARAVRAWRGRARVAPLCVGRPKAE